MFANLGAMLLARGLPVEVRPILDAARSALSG